jgi:hypothetical protein
MRLVHTGMYRDINIKILNIIQNNHHLMQQDFYIYQDAEHKACCIKSTVLKAASEKYIPKLISLSEKANMRNLMRMTGVRKCAPEIQVRGSLGLTFHLKCMSELKCHVSSVRQPPVRICRKKWSVTKK